MRLLTRREEISAAIRTVERARAGLKQMYRGIDQAIDQICDLVTPWYAIPEAVTRPIVICLWGMTGTGKTSIVRNICGLYLKRPLIQIDLGSFTQERDFSMEFYRHYADHSGSHSIILLDEIQNPRTIDEGGAEQDREGLRGMWSLLSDGIIIPDIRLEKDECIISLENIANTYDTRGGAPPPAKKKQNGEQEGSDGDDDTAILLKRLMRDEASDGDDGEDDGIPWEMSYDHMAGYWKLDRWLIERCLLACNRRGLAQIKQMQQRIQQDFRGSVSLLLSWLYNIDVQPTLDFSKCLIVITGNVDEVYDASYDTSPDITADVLHDWSKQISVPDVKQTLLKRFRPEQVARLGNNHVLYPTLRGDDFRQIIRDDLERVRRFHSEHFDVDLEFDLSVEDLIYREGVLPTQGARPVLATTATIIDGALPSCLMDLAERHSKDDPDRCRVRIGATMDPSSLTFHEIIDDDLIEISSMPLMTLSLEKLRQPLFDDDHSSIAVHESGHALATIIEVGEIPNKVSAFTANPDAMGFMDRKFKEDDQLETKSQSIRDVICALSGWAAEIVIFGAQNLSRGGERDIAEATAMVTAHFKRFGFAGEPILLHKPSSDKEDTAMATEDDDEKIRLFLRQMGDYGISLMKEHRHLLLDISRHLISTTSMTGEDVMQICADHGVEIASYRNRKEMLLDAFRSVGIEPPSI